MDNGESTFALSLSLPLGSERTAASPPTFVLPAIGGARPALVVSTAPVARDAELGPWVLDELSAQERLLEDPQLLAYEHARLAGEPATRTLLSHTQDGVAVTLLQWWALAGPRAIVLSASCATPHYAQLAPTFDAIAEGARIHA